MRARSAPVLEPRGVRASGALLAGPALLTICGLIAAWRALIPGVAYWDNAVGALVASVRITGPLAAGLAALIAARTPPVRMRDGLLRTAGVATGSYAALVIGVAVKTLLATPSGEPAPSGIAAGLAALLLHVGLGYVAGSLVRTLATAPAVALATYAAAGWALAHDGAWWRLLAPMATPPETVFALGRPAVFHAQLAWCAGLGLAAVLAYALGVRHRRRYVLPLVAAVALACSGAALLHQYRGRALIVSAATDLACRDWPLTICVHPALRGALPDLEMAAMPVAARLAGTPGAFRRLEQVPDGAAPARVRPDTRRLTVPSLSPGYTGVAMTSVVERIPDRTACSTPGTDPGATALVLRWLATGRVDPRSPYGTEFTRMGEPARRAWLRGHYEQVRTCRLHPRDFTWRQAAPRSA